MNCVGFAFIFVQFTCVLDTPPPAIDTFCQNYTPVYFSPADTRKTKEQNDNNNRKHKRLCPVKK